MNRVVRKEQDFILGSNGHAGLSNRKTAELLKVETSTIGRLLKGVALFAKEEAEEITQYGFQGVALVRVIKYFSSSSQVSSSTKSHCLNLLEQMAIIGAQSFIDTMAGVQNQQEYQSAPIKPQDGSEEIKNVVAEWLGHIFAKTRILVNEVSRESDRCFALIAKKASDEQLNLVNAIKKGIDEIELEIIARKAINSIMHRVPHQPGKISQVIDEQVHAYQEEFVQTLVAQLMALQVLKQPAPPPALPSIIIQRPRDTRRKIEDFLCELESMSAQERKNLLMKVPNLTQREETVGRWSSRLVARYLGLAPGQDRTVSNVMQERGWKP